MALKPSADNTSRTVTEQLRILHQNSRCSVHYKDFMAQVQTQIGTIPIRFALQFNKNLTVTVKMVRNSFQRLSYDLVISPAWEGIHEQREKITPAGETWFQQ
jgi:hypothetical protein